MRTWREKKFLRIIRRTILCLIILGVVSISWVIHLYDEIGWRDGEIVLYKIDAENKIKDIDSMKCIIDSLSHQESRCDTIMIRQRNLYKNNSDKFVPIDTFKTDTSKLEVIPIDTTIIDTIK